MAESIVNKAPKKVVKNTPMRNVWRKLCQNKLAVICLVYIVILVIVAIIAKYIAPYDYAAQDYANILQYPSAAHLFGTDNFGRDVFSRILYGTSYTIWIGFGCETVATLIGIFFGLIAACYPKADNIIMRVMDLIIGIPGMTLLMCLVAVMGVSLLNMCIALCIYQIPSTSRVVRAQAMTVRSQEFIEAEVAIGASQGRIIMKHILPNSWAPILIRYTLGVGSVVLWSASLSFIGMGVQMPLSEWGLMISAGRAYLREYWFLSIIPGLAIMSLTVALNLLGDGLRDALDPRLNK